MLPFVLAGQRSDRQALSRDVRSGGAPFGHDHVETPPLRCDVGWRRLRCLRVERRDRAELRQPLAELRELVRRQVGHERRRGVVDQAEVVVVSLCSRSAVRGGLCRAASTLRAPLRMPASAGRRERRAAPHTKRRTARGHGHGRTGESSASRSARRMRRILGPTRDAFTRPAATYLRRVFVVTPRYSAASATVSNGSCAVRAGMLRGLRSRGSFARSRAGGRRSGHFEELRRRAGLPAPANGRHGAIGLSQRKQANTVVRL